SPGRVASLGGLALETVGRQAVVPFRRGCDDGVNGPSQHHTSAGIPPAGDLYKSETSPSWTRLRATYRLPTRTMRGNPRLPAARRAAGTSRAGQMWVSGYYVGWRQSHLEPRDIDFGALTHLVHFAAYPRGDGSLDPEGNRLDPRSISRTVSAAHAAGRKILV